MLRFIIHLLISFGDDRQINEPLIDIYRSLASQINVTTEVEETKKKKKLLRTYRLLLEEVQGLKHWTLMKEKASLKKPCLDFNRVVYYF